VHAVDLGEAAARDAMAAAQARPGDIVALICVSSSGYLLPSLDVHLVNRLRLNPACRRLPLSQLGWAGGVAAISLAAELLRHRRQGQVLVVAVELPSLMLQLGEPSMTDLLSLTQFGDGAGAAVLSPETTDGSFEVLATKSVLLPNSSGCDGVRL